MLCELSIICILLISCRDNDRSFLVFSNLRESIKTIALKYKLKYSGVGSSGPINSEAWENDKFKDGDLLVLAAFGSGFTWGSVIMRW